MEKTTKEEKGVVTSIRLKKELCSQIDKEAEKAKRSRTKQIEYMLESWFEIKKFQ